jgi:hypothetical protein
MIEEEGNSAPAGDRPGKERRSVESEPTPTLFDSELDPPRRPPPALRVESIGPYQRLIVNPFLAVLGWLMAAALIRYSTRSRNLPLYLGALLWLFVPFLLIQFHCLDCGATGWYLRARRHACGAVVARWQRGEWRRFRGPGAKAQLVIWLYVLLAAAILYLVGFRTRH